MTRQSLPERARRKKSANKQKTTVERPAENTPQSRIMADRTNAIENMNSKLFERFQEIETGLNDLRAENIRYYYKLGLICKDIAKNPTEYAGKDGTDALQLIEKALSTQQRTIRLCVRAATEFTEAQINSIIDMHHKATNFQLHWGHIMYLLTRKNWEERLKWAKIAINEMLDPKALHDAMIARDGNMGPAHGRNHLVPLGAAKQIRQMMSVSKIWLAKQQAVWKGNDNNVFTNVCNLSPDDITSDIRDNLETIAETMEKMIDEVNENIVAARSTLKHVEETMARRADEIVGEKGARRESRRVDLE